MMKFTGIAKRSTLFQLGSWIEWQKNSLVYQNCSKRLCLKQPNETNRII